MSAVVDWAVRYIQEHHFKLVSIPRGTKGPKETGWTQPGRYITDAKVARQRWSNGAEGIGVVLGPSGLCSGDIDYPEHAERVLGKLGIDLPALRRVTPTIVGNPARYRMVFAAPAGVALSRKALVWPPKNPGEKPITLFELRAGDIQDVLPPTIHPDFNIPYIWDIPLNGALPPLPESMLELWLNWDSYRKEFEAMCPWGEGVFKPKPAPRGAGARPGVIAAFNRVHTVEELLEAHKYKRRGNRWISPTSSTGLAGAVILDDGKVYSHHTSDPIADGHAHDAFDVYRILVHGGDTRSAVRAAAEELGIEEPAYSGRRNLKDSSGPAPEEESERDLWPAPLAEVAYHGLAGEMVGTILPDTECDPAALLVQTLVAFGTTVGRGAYCQVEGTRHHGNLFALIIGRTASGRKGTSMGRILEIFNLVQECPKIVRGASTGEGLKFAIRDPAPAKPKKRRFKRHHLDPYCDDDEGDPGCADKRVIVYESEFGQVLRVIPRQGNTLTVALKEFWDGNDIGSLTRHDPMTVTAPHLSFIGHITGEELRSCLSPVEIASGFANRFLMVCSEKSKSLPEGGEPLDQAKAHFFARRIARCAGLALGVGRVTRTEEGSGFWASIYEGLGTGEGAVARAAPQVLRLSLLYALLDESARVDAVHIEAALAVWQYCQASVRHVFESGDVGGVGNPALGDLLCERVLRWIQKAPEGQTERHLYRRFGGRVPVEQIRRAAASLAESRLATTQVRVASNGRDVTWWLPA